MSMGIIATIVTVIFLIFIFSKKAGNSPLSEMIKSGDVAGAEKEIDEIIKLKIDINTIADTGLAPIHYTALHNQQAIAEILFKHGADINCQSEAAKNDEGKTLDILSGSTPLHIAMQGGHKSFADFLLAQGADQSIKNREGDEADT